ncbi:unnamed protein product [Closterium sp. NIES-65]|nr:unnamed protein product [Closterium sp. NIES-65]
MVAERRIGLVMEVACTSMIHAAAPHSVAVCGPVDPLPLAEPVEVAVDSGAAEGCAAWGAEPERTELAGAEPGVAESEATRVVFGAPTFGMALLELGGLPLETLELEVLEVLVLEVLGVLLELEVPEVLEMVVLEVLLLEVLELPALVVLLGLEVLAVMLELEVPEVLVLEVLVLEVLELPELVVLLVLEVLEVLELLELVLQQALELGTLELALGVLELSVLRHPLPSPPASSLADGPNSNRASVTLQLASCLTISFGAASIIVPSIVLPGAHEVPHIALLRVPADNRPYAIHSPALLLAAASCRQSLRPNRAGSPPVPASDLADRVAASPLLGSGTPHCRGDDGALLRSGGMRLSAMARRSPA